jgi:hypothetical protein
MNYRQIIGEAWIFTQENKRLIVWYAFIPSILTTLFGVLYILYQFYSFKSFFQNGEDNFSFVVIREAFSIVRSHVDNIVPLLVLVGLFAIAYFTLPSITEGAMVQLIARKKNQQQIRIRDGLRYGFMSFLPLFNYSWISRSFNLIVIAGEMGLIVRHLPLEVMRAFMPIFILIILVSIIFSVLFIFTEYFIIIDDAGIKEAMARSAKLVIKHWESAIMLSILLVVIALRILLQIIFVLLVPVLILTGIYFLAASSIPMAGLIVGTIIGAAALFFASYLGAVVHVFTSSVWVFTFLELTGTPEISAREAPRDVTINN